jgi:hypothetical protein
MLVQIFRSEAALKQLNDVLESNPVARHVDGAVRFFGQGRRQLHRIVSQDGTYQL